MAEARPRLVLVPGVTGAAPPDPRVVLAEFVALGAGLALTMTLAAWLPGGAHALGALQSLAAAGFVFLGLALLRLDRYRGVPRVSLLVFAVALAARAAFVVTPPLLSDDLYRYVWEGRVLAHGFDPWRLAPIDPALASLRDAVIFPRVNHPELSTIYPPLAEAGFALVAALSPTVWAMKLWVIAHDLALVAVLCAWCERKTGSAAPAIAYAWNPLVVLEYAGSAHQDPTALVWLALALMWADARPARSALALAAGVLVKLAPLAALPFLLKRWPWRARVVAVVAIGVGLAAFALETRGAASGARAYWSSWRNNELAFLGLERALGSFRAARAAALAAGAAVAAWWWIRSDSAARATRAVLRTLTALGPVLHPWYLGWTLVFEPVALSAPWLLLSFTVLLNYGVFAAPAAPATHHPSLAVRAFEWGAPAALALVLALRRAWRSRRPEEEPDAR